MGLTLVSVGKITSTGYKAIFGGSSCQIYDTKDNIIDQIYARNGLYRVDHRINQHQGMTVAVA